MRRSSRTSAYPTGLIVSPAAVMDHGEKLSGRNPSGTGAFSFTELAARTRPQWCDRGQPRVLGRPRRRLDPPSFRPITTHTRVAEILSGGIDLMVEVPPRPVGIPRRRIRVVEQAAPSLVPDPSTLREGPFTEQAVGQGPEYSIDKEALVNDVLEGTPPSPRAPRRPRFSHGPITRRWNPSLRDPTGLPEWARRGWRTPNHLLT